MSPTSRRSSLLWNGLLVTGLLLITVGATLWWRDDGRPERIILVVVDTLRRDHVSVYGASQATPHIAELAARGQVFDNVVASFHQTSMSMAAMFTGRTPSIESGDPRETLPWNSSTWCGLLRFASGDSGATCIPRSVPTLAEHLRTGSYWTIGIASNQFLYEPSGFGRGFDDWVEVDKRPPVPGPDSWKDLPNPHTSRYWKTVNERAFEALGRRPSDRFFLYVHYIDVHDYKLQKMSYAKSVELVDRALGELLAGLDEEGLLDDSVVIFTSDHGERLGDAHGLPGEFPNQHGHFGNPSFQELLWLPLVVAPPIVEDTRSLLRTQDLFGLVLDVAGLPFDPSQDTEADELYVGERFYRTYRRGPWKSSVKRKNGKAVLFNLDDDPEELDDVSGQNRLRVLAHRNRINELTTELRGKPEPHRELSDDEKQRLRILGYLNE